MDYGPDPGVAPWVRSCCRRRGLILPERAVLADGSPPSRRASGPVAQWERSSFTPSRLGVRVPPGLRRMPAETLTPLGQGGTSSSDARGASPRARPSCGRSRRSPQHVSVAQWRAHLVPNQGVAGSSPAGDTHGEHECRVRNAFVAQWKARLTTNQEVGGSSPSKGTGTARYCDNCSAPLAEMALAPGFYPGDGGSSPSRRTCPAGHRVAEMRRPPGTGT